MDDELIFALVIASFGMLLILVGVYDVYHTKSLMRGGLPRKTEETDDFLEAKDRMLEYIEDRVKKEVCCCIGNKDIKDMGLESLKDSSDVASLTRFAHYAGYHITLEQTPDSGVDMDNGPDVFRTNMAKARTSREEKKWNRYRRY